jgi:hypothetical protein
MDPREALVAASSAAYASLSLWFYLHCVQPALKWTSARWTALGLMGALSIAPTVTMVAMPGNLTAQLVSAVGFIVLVVAWTSPRLVVRATGGPAPARHDLDAVLGSLAKAESVSRETSDSARSGPSTRASSWAMIHPDRWSRRWP